MCVCVCAFVGIFTIYKKLSKQFTYALENNLDRFHLETFCYDVDDGGGDAYEDDDDDDDDDDGDDDVTSFDSCIMERCPNRFEKSRPK